MVEPFLLSQVLMIHRTEFAKYPQKRKERSDFGCLLRRSVTRIGLANFVNQSGFRKLAASQSQVEGNQRENVGNQTYFGSHFFLSFSMKSSPKYPRVKSILGKSNFGLRAVTKIIALSVRKVPKFQWIISLVKLYFYQMSDQNSRIEGNWEV